METLRETKITAQQFIDENYKAKIDAHECRVVDEFPLDDFLVTDIKQGSRTLEVFYSDAPSDACGIHSTTPLRVDWLPPQPPAAPPVDETAGSVSELLLNQTGEDLEEAQDRIAELETELAEVLTKTANHILDMQTLCRRAAQFIDKNATRYFQMGPDGGHKHYGETLELIEELKRAAEDKKP